MEDGGSNLLDPAHCDPHALLIGERVLSQNELDSSIDDAAPEPRHSRPRFVKKPPFLGLADGPGDRAQGHSTQTTSRSPSAPPGVETETQPKRI
jgi:hypothetical protein